MAITLKEARLGEAEKVLKEAVQIRYSAFVQIIVDFLIIPTYHRMQPKQQEETPGPMQEELLAEFWNLLKKQEYTPTTLVQYKRGSALHAVK